MCVKTAAMYQALKKVFFTEARCLSDEASKSFEALFDKLDVNKDGKVDIAELRAGLADMGFSVGADAAQVNPEKHALETQNGTLFTFSTVRLCALELLSVFIPHTVRHGVEFTLQ